MAGTRYGDENGKYEFDFAQCEVWEYHSLAQRTNLSDVDFVINSKDEVIFLEYKMPRLTELLIQVLSYAN